MRTLNLLILFGIGLGLTLWGEFPVLASKLESTPIRGQHTLRDSACECPGCDPNDCSSCYNWCTASQSNASSANCPNEYQPDINSCCCSYCNYIC